MPSVRLTYESNVSHEGRLDSPAMYFPSQLHNPAPVMAPKSAVVWVLRYSSTSVRAPKSVDGSFDSGGVTAPDIRMYPPARGRPPIYFNVVVSDEESWDWVVTTFSLLSLCVLYFTPTVARE
jgi:hypothetical protein